MQKHMKIVLTKMCETVGIKFEAIDFKKQNWHRDYEWGLKQIQEFSDWYLKYLTNNAEARVELMRIPTDSEYSIKQAVAGFMSNFGWKQKITGDSYDTTRT